MEDMNKPLDQQFESNNDTQPECSFNNTEVNNDQASESDSASESESAEEIISAATESAAEDQIPIDDTNDVPQTAPNEPMYNNNTVYQQQYHSNNQQQYYANSQQSYGEQRSYAYPNEPVKPVKKKGKGLAVFIALSCFLVIGAATLFAVLMFGDDIDSGNSLTEVPKLSAVSTAETPEEGLSAAEVYQKVFKSSVSILAYDQKSGDLGVLGSGVIFQEDDQRQYSYVVTCAHVISDAAYNLKVELWNGSIYSAEVVNFDEGSDIGVIRIKEAGLQIAEFADSDAMQPGATVYAIGSPYSSKFAGTFTRGIVSAVNRLVTTQTNYQLCCIQHDAAINSGNSGGALVNAYGQVVGINALKINVSNYEGLGFAVPSNTAIKIINSIIETGIAPKAAKLGISYVQAIYYSQFLSDVVEENNLPAGSILVAEINEDSSLYNTEMKVNDIIIAVNGEDLTDPDLLVKFIQDSTVGDTLELTVIRLKMNEDDTDYTDIETYTITATLVELDLTADKQEDQYEGQEDFYEYFGDDSGDYEDFYDYFYDYFYGENAPDGNQRPSEDKGNEFTIPE